MLFDMDNTLFNFIHAQQAACRAVLLHCGDGSDPEALFAYFRRPVHGFEDYGNIRDFLRDRNAFSDRLFAECCAIYEEEKVAAVTPYPGIRAILESLERKGIPLGIITDAESGHAARRLEKAGLAPFFRTVVTPDRSGARKPDPRPFLLALRELEASPRQCALIGDSIRRDILPAQKIGMVTVYAQYGDGYRADSTESCRPDYTAKTVAEMERVLAGMTGYLQE
ncbi:MAG TPA: HAD family hydrolase [Methanoregulaceae archaeon]|nr:HAD family hydrolase [Methanoregulaceae archaeon]